MALSMDSFIIKRKEFVVTDKLGEKSFLVTRKNKKFFLKKFTSKEEFLDFIERVHRLKITAIDIPKPILFDKNQLIFVSEYIEGKPLIDMLKEGPITDEKIYEELFRTDFFMKHEKIKLDLLPENFIFTGKRFVYLTYKYEIYPVSYSFINKDVRLWFDTKELMSYLAKFGYEMDIKRLSSEYLTNKQIALMSVKYYR